MGIVADNQQQAAAVKSGAVIIGFFVAGVAFGRLVVSDLQLDFGLASHVALCALLLFVGIGIGGDASALSAFRRLNPRLTMLPVVSVAGALAGSLVAGLLAGGHSVSEWFAVGSGMGYYSVSSVLIGQSKGGEQASLGLLANVVREVIALLAAPLLARLFGPLAPIAAAGATAMDTTLPAVTRASGGQYAPVAVCCGMATDFSVPFLVTLFCSM